jgi:uncharacterized repeat protein (TIGR04076 family)
VGKIADVRISILKRTFNREIVEAYAREPENWKPCQVFEEGQSFLVSRDEPWNKPENFCGWLWADIQKMVWGMARGGPDHFVTCCTDGYRPVIVKLERVET